MRQFLGARRILMSLASSYHSPGLGPGVAMLTTIRSVACTAAFVFLNPLCARMDRAAAVCVSPPASTAPPASAPRRTTTNSNVCHKLLQVTYGLMRMLLWREQHPNGAHSTGGDRWRHGDDAHTLRRS